MNLEIGTQLVGQDNRRYLLKKKLSPGSHGISFLGKTLAADKHTKKEENLVFIKSVNLKGKTNPSEVQKRLSRLKQAFEHEMLHRQRLAKVANIAHVLDYGVFALTVTDCDFQIPFLVQEYIDGTSLNVYLAGESSRPIFKGLTSAEEWLKLAIKLIAIVDSIHSQQIIHGDIWPSNVLIKRGEPILIDFGQSFIRDHGLYLDKQAYNENEYLAPERLKKSSLPWEAPADIYALGVLLFYCATGNTTTPHKAEEMSDGDLREYIKVSLKRSNPTIYADNPCLTHIIAQCLYINPHDRSAAFDLLRLAESFLSMSQGGILDLSPPAKLLGKLNSLNDLTLGEISQLSPVFRRLYDYSLSIFIKRTHQLLGFQRLEVSGDRNETLNFLIDFLSVLKPGDFYWTVTSPEFWSPNNLGTKGRFYDVNLAMCLKGISVRRIFIATKEELAGAIPVKNVFAVQRKLITTLRASDINVRALKEKDPGVFIGIVECETPKEKRMHLNDGYIVGLSCVSNQFYALSFKSEGTGRLVRKITIELPQKEQVKKHLARFNELLAKSTNILDYPAIG